MTLTKIQDKIYKLILTHYQKHGYSPTTTSLALKLGVSRQTVEQHIDAVVKKGLITKPRKGVLIPVDNFVA